MKLLFIQIIIILISLVLFLPFLGRVHLFDWDEINFAECTREMIVSGDYLMVQINFLPFHEKPPLFFWLQSLTMNIFGINEFSARLPNVICGIITLLVLFNIGRKLYDTKFGLIWVITYLCSILPFFYFKTAIIDPWFNLFIFLGLYYFIQSASYELRATSFIFLSGLFIGLAILTKGPVALLIFLLTTLVYWIFNRFKLNINFYQIILFILVLCFTGGSWFIFQVINGKSSLIADFINYQIRLFTTKDADHGGFLFYHFVVLLFGVFPASILALPSFVKKESKLNSPVDPESEKLQDNNFQKTFKLWMFILFWVTLILFTIVKTKIMHYSSLCYFPLTFLGSYVIYKILHHQVNWSKWLGALVIIVGSIIALAEISLQFIAKYKQQIINSGIIKDAFAIANLQADVFWSEYEFLIGTILIAGIILSLILIRKKHFAPGFIVLFTSTLIFTNLVMFFIIPKIEQYTQNAPIIFYKEHKNQDCYIETLGFKSYAHLFYTEKPIPTNNQSYDKQWLLTGNIDKPVYFVCKITDAEKYQNQYPELKKLYEKYGFVFFRRDP